MIPTLLSLSLLSFMGFVVVGRRTLETPLVPLRTLAKRSIWSLFAITYFKDMAFLTVSWLSVFLFERPFKTFIVT